MKPPPDRAFRTAVTILAGILAAPPAHVAIDALGDVVLPHDAFDGLPHGSRTMVLAAGCCIAAALAVYLIRRALRDTRDGTHRARAALLRLIAAPVLRTAITIAPVALAGVMAMEALDVLEAGRAIDDPGDLLSGSVPFGIAVTLAVAVFVASALRVVAWFGLATHDRVAAVLAYLLRPRGAEAPRLLRRRADARTPRSGARPVRCSGLRAPPRCLLALP